MPVKRIFVLGRRDRGSTMLVLLRTVSGPIVGPWTLKAVISKN